MTSHLAPTTLRNTGRLPFAAACLSLALVHLARTPAEAAPAHNDFSKSALIGGSSVRVSDSNSGASKEPGEPAHGGEAGGSSVWWRWTAPATGPVALDTFGSETATVLAVYTGTRVDTLTHVASDRTSGTGGSSGLVFPATAGTTYSIAVDRLGAQGGPLTLTLEATQMAVSTLAGQPGTPGTIDGNGTNARFNRCTGVVADRAGNLFVVDSPNFTIRKILPTGEVTTFAGVAGSRGSVDGTGAAARFGNPWGIAIDSDDTLYVADQANHVIRKITPSAQVTTLAGAPGVAGSQDGTGAEARFRQPLGVAVDREGNVYVADLANHLIRKVTKAGVVTTLAGAAGVRGTTDGPAADARFASPFAVSLDSKQNLYVADTGNHSVRRITPDGVVSTVAGTGGQIGSADGTGSAARFNNPNGLVVEPITGDVYVADTGNHVIRRVSAAGVVTTLAGLSGTIGGVDGLGTEARFQFPSGVTIDRAGRIVVADNGNSAVRRGTLQVVAPTESARLLNLSTRGLCLTGADVLIPGFVIGGTANKRVLVRAIGPRLADFGVSGTLADPVISVKQLVAGGSIDIASNDNWGTGNSPGELAAVGATVGAFPLVQGSSDAAALLNLPPGGYTVVASGVRDGTGVALVELYELDAGGESRFANIATRGYVGTGGNLMIVGATLGGSGSRTLLVRVVGPTLGTFGVTGALADPRISIYRSESDGTTTLIGGNDDWENGPNPDAPAAMAARVGAFPLPSRSKDAALVVTLQPGAYSLHASGGSNGTGTALVEVYSVP